jgi:hypothetical protein
MNSPDYITHEEIRARAQQLWERAGRPEGRDEEHWLAAEKELQGERDRHHHPADTVAPAAHAPRPRKSR